MTQSGPDPEGSVEAAMARALQAERDAEAAVRQCRREAELQVVESRRAARAIAARTDARISALHQSCARKTKQRIRALVEEGRQRAAEPKGWDEPRLQRAARRLAARLTGDGEDPFRVTPL